MLHTDTDPAGEEWVEERLLRLLHGKCSGVAAGMRRSATKRGIQTPARKDIDKAAAYLLKYKMLVQYQIYLADGLPIATGVIEGACRYWVKHRMDITGARWSLDGAEAVLRLRALLASGDFDAYWQFHESREQLSNHDILYEARAQTCLMMSPKRAALISFAAECAKLRATS
ncbi:MAG: hypothetical protein GY811_00245 [Myxococcales bacterium]|nr:hypothetical protein [Myxococcales bacterium]